MRPTVVIGSHNWGYDTCKVQVCVRHLNHKKQLQGAHSHDAAYVGMYVDVLTETMEVFIPTLFSLLLCTFTSICVDMAWMSECVTVM